MKQLTKILMTLGLVLVLGNYISTQDLLAQQGKGNPDKGFVDLNGDGINDNAIDSDGDGIPNGQDPDYVRPQNGTGQKIANQFKCKFAYQNQGMISNLFNYKFHHGYMNGNGQLTNKQTDIIKNKSGNAWGPGDGTGNNHIGPYDGTGYGSGSGDCDGTGPHGRRGVR
jgi:hypothetical protein